MPFKDKGKLKEYRSRPEVKAKTKEYNSRPENRAKAKERSSRPENKEKKKEQGKVYRSRPEVRARIKERSSKPERKEKQKKYYQKNKEKIKEYQSRPENKAKKKAYSQSPENKARQKKYDSRPERIERIHEIRSDIKLQVFTEFSKRLSNSNIPCCACCGKNSHIVFLTIDHIVGKKYQDDNNLKGGDLYRWLKRHNYPEGYQVLCWNCNSAKGLSGKCPHQLDKMKN